MTNRALREPFFRRLAQQACRAALAFAAAATLGATGAARAQPAGTATAAAASAASAPTPSSPAERDDLRPALEILGFQVLLNRVDYAIAPHRDDYRVTVGSIRRNLGSSWGTDRDPFSTNQLGHPYQGSIYYGFARSTGHDYWQSAGYAFAGSVVWEIAGEATRPSRNDQVASGIGGTFLGEALFRMSNLVLEQGGGLPRFWREVAATAIAPSAGFNRLAYADRFGGIFSSHGAAYFSRLDIGATTAFERQLGSSTTDFERKQAQVGFSIDYGLPGNKAYEYRRPFDYFRFEATASSANAVENVLTRGMLVGSTYEAGPDYRGIWGLYGSYDYISPQAFRISSTALSLGSTAQWRLSPSMALLGTAMAGLGYAAVGTTHGTVGARDYNYGVAPQVLVALRLTMSDRAALDVTGREYFVSNVASGTSGGHDNIARGEAALTWRLTRQQALTLKTLVTRRDATYAATPGNRHQTVATVGLFWTLLGADRFGSLDWK